MMEWRKITRAAIAVVLVLSVLMCVTSCGLLPISTGETTVTLLVRGNLDALYLGEFDDDYLKLIDSDEETELQTYMEGIMMTAEYFAWYWGIIDTDADESLADLDEKLQQDIIDLCVAISDQVKYEVQPAAKQKDGSYTVKVLITPVTIMEEACEVYDKGSYRPLEDYLKKSQNADWDNMSSKEYWAMTNEYGQIIVDMVSGLLPELSYGEQKSMVIQVNEDEDGYLQMNGDDLAVFDSYVIPYP